MFNIFKNKTKASTEYQKVFIKAVEEIFNPTFKKHLFINIKKEANEQSCILVFKKNEKYIRIYGLNDYRGDGSFYEISIGEKFNIEINDFEGYHITIERLSRLINQKKQKMNYNFPYGKKEALKSLIKAKEELLKYASFYFFEEEDLFDRVLRIKGIKK